MNENVIPNENSIDMSTIEINPELKSLIYPLSFEEYELLEKSIIDDGCRDALILWGKIIIDGHNRYEICKKNNIEFKTFQKDFEDIEYAKEWIIINQFSRRNLNPYQHLTLSKKLKKIYQLRLKENQKLSKGRGKKGPQLSEDLNTGKDKKRKDGTHKPRKKDIYEKLAEVTGYSTDTINKFDKVDTSENDEVISAVKSGSIKINQAYLLIDKNIDEKTKIKVDKALELIQNEANDKTKEELIEGKKYLSEAIKEIKADKKSKKLEEKKAEYIEKYKGDLITIPEVSLMDCKDFLNTFSDDSIDFLYTDPPYMTDIPEGKVGEFVENWLNLAIQKTKKSGRMLVFSGAYPMEIQAFLNVLLSQDKFIVDTPLVWVFNNTLGVTPKMKYNLNYQLIWHLYSNESSELDTSITNDMFSAQVENAPDGRIGNKLHTWQKPDELAIKHITQTTKKGDIVVDPFTCTGTFLIAASKLGRIGKGCDNNQANLDIAISRGCQLVIKEVEKPEENE